MSSSHSHKTYRSLLYDSDRPHGEWILRPWSRLTDSRVFIEWLGHRLGALRRYLSSTPFSKQVVDQDRYNSELVRLFQPLVPGLNDVLRGNLINASFSFGLSTNSGLREVKVIGGPTYETSPSVMKQLEWADERKSLLNCDAGADLDTGGAYNKKILKRKLSDNADPAGRRTSTSLNDNAGCYLPDLFGHIRSCGPGPRGKALGVHYLEHDDGDKDEDEDLAARPHRFRALDPPRASDATHLLGQYGQPSMLHSAFNPTSTSLPPRQVASLPSLDPLAATRDATPDPSTRSAALRSRNPTPNTKARIADEQRGINCGVWIQGEIKPHRENTIEGTTRAFTYASVSHGLCGCWIAINIVENRWRRMVMLEEGVIAVETANQDRWGNLSIFGKEFCDTLHYHHLPHCFMRDPSSAADLDDEDEEDGPIWRILGQFDLDAVGRLWDTIRLAAEQVVDLDPRQPLHRFMTPAETATAPSGTAWAEIRTMVDAARTRSLDTPSLSAIRYQRVDLNSDFDFLSCISRAGHGERQARLDKVLSTLPNREAAVVVSNPASARTNRPSWTTAGESSGHLDVMAITYPNQVDLAGCLTAERDAVDAEPASTAAEAQTPTSGFDTQQGDCRPIAQHSRRRSNDSDDEKDGRSGAGRQVGRPKCGTEGLPVSASTQTAQSNNQTTSATKSTQNESATVDHGNVDQESAYHEPELDDGYTATESSTGSLLHAPDSMQSNLLWDSIPVSSADAGDDHQHVSGSVMDTERDSYLGFGEDAGSYEVHKELQHGLHMGSEEGSAAQEVAEMRKTASAFAALEEKSLRVLSVSPALMDKLIVQGCGLSVQRASWMGERPVPR